MPKIATTALLMLATATGCGDPLIDSSEPVVSFVSRTQTWWDKYGPNITADVWFPELDLVIAPRLESANPAVATVELRTTPFDDPRMRDVRIRTRNIGSSEIRLFDGDSLVRSESIEVLEPEGVKFDFVDERANRADIERRHPARPTMFLLEPSEAIGVLPHSITPGVLQFHDRDGNEILTSGRIDSEKIRLLFQTAFLQPSRTFYSGDSIELFRPYNDPCTSVSVPPRRTLMFCVQNVNRARIDRLSIRSKVIPETELSEALVQVAVYGLVDGYVVPGLSPVLRVNGELVRSSGSWIFHYPLSESNGEMADTLEATWSNATGTALGPSP